MYCIRMYAAAGRNAQDKPDTKSNVGNKSIDRVRERLEADIMRVNGGAQSKRVSVGVKYRRFERRPFVLC